MHSAGGDEAPPTRRQEKARELDDAYAMAGKGQAEHQGGGKKEKEIVLLFAFNDGELKAANGVGKVVTRKTA